MAWKPKEKPLTAEEALSLARKELKPRWYGSSPLIAAFRAGDTVTAHPLDPAIGNGQWLLLFLDPFDLIGEAALDVLREWRERYASLGLGFIAIFDPSYDFAREPAFLAAFGDARSLPFPAMMDSDGTLAAAFRVSSRPHAVLMAGGNVLKESSGSGWQAGLELTLQNFLRKKDPGLPLLPEFNVVRREPDARLELGSARGVRVTGDAQGRITIKKPVPEHFKPGEFFITGQWQQTPERIETQDPEAAVAFHAPRGRVAVVASSLAGTAESAVVAVELGGVPAYDQFAGSQLEAGDEGQSVARVNKPGIYHLLQSLPERDRDVILKFPLAQRCPVAVYGLRFSD